MEAIDVLKQVPVADEAATRALDGHQFAAIDESVEGRPGYPAKQTPGLVHRDEEADRWLGAGRGRGAGLHAPERLTKRRGVGTQTRAGLRVRFGLPRLGLP